MSEGLDVYPDAGLNGYVWMKALIELAYNVGRRSLCLEERSFIELRLNPFWRHSFIEFRL